MATKDFDYENFAQNLAAQAQELVPPEFNDNQKQYVINTLGNFAMLSGKALAEDPALNFNADQAITITQIIAEWSFHKSVDLIRSGIPQQYWDAVMQKIAYTIFEIAKQTFTQGLPHEKILELIEHHVKKSYLDAITELRNKGAIDDGLMEFAASQSNMDKMAQEMQQQQASGEISAPNQSNNGLPLPSGNVPTEFPKVDSKALKLATVAMLFNKMKQDKVQSILNKFDPDDAQTVIKYMRIPDLAERVGTANALRCLQEIKMNLPKARDLTPNKIVYRLRKAVSKYSRKEIDTILIRERMEVKRLVFNALEGKYYENMPPKVASIVATHLADSV
ncbi:hypothetical protein IJ541_08485 [bacterium]|nr:hypothetical protein [bacterium]